MNSISVKVIDLDRDVTDAHAMYIKLHDQFNAYRGRPLNDDDVKVINTLIEEIQNRYQDIYPFLHLLAHRATFANNMVDSHNTWIDQLKKAGALEENITRKMQ